MKRRGKKTYGERLRSLIFMSHESQKKRRETVGSIGMRVDDPSSAGPLLSFPSQNTSASHE